MNDRLGKCYQLSYQFIMRHPDYCLVHGYITNRDNTKTIDHAWTEKDDIVFDPVIDYEFPKEVYYILYNVEVAKTYENSDAINKGLETGVYGPWHDIPDEKIKFNETIETFNGSPIKFINKLNESLSKIVYHATTCENFQNILSTNKFYLTSTLGTDADNLNEYFYYMSFSTNKTGGYTLAKMSVGQVVLKINGDKLGNNFKGFHVDYWGSAYRPSVIRNKDDVLTHLKHDENEERLVSNKDEILNATSYIEEAHILLSTNNEGREALYNLEDNLSKSIKEIIDYSRIFNIPVYYYDNISDFKVQNKSKSILKYGQEISYQKAVLDLFDVKDIRKLPNEFPYDRLKDALMYGSFRLKDFISALKADIHNNKTNEKYRKEIKDFTNLMIRYKVKSINDLMTIAKKFNINESKVYFNKSFEKIIEKCCYNEAKQVGNIYHFTSMYSLLSILKENRLYSSKNRICFTRNKLFSHTSRIGINGSSAKITLDGNKLSNKYKINPFNYFDETPRFGNSIYPGFDKDENEETILTDEIPNVVNYITNICIYRNVAEYAIEKDYKTKRMIMLVLQNMGFDIQDEHDVTFNYCINVIKNICNKYDIPFEIK